MASVRNRIILQIERDRQTGRNVWCSLHTGPHAAEIVDLFGTATIPTAFFAAMPAAEVLAEIRRLNPGVEVSLAA